MLSCAGIRYLILFCGIVWFHMMSHTTFEALFTNIMLPFLFYSLVSHAILTATNQPACNKDFFTLYCDISTHQ